MKWMSVTITMAVLAATVAMTRCGLADGTSADAVGPQEQRVLATEDAYAEAEVQRDEAALRRLLADRFVYNDADGTTSGKEELIRAVLGMNMTAQTLSERSVMLVGDMALVFGTTELQFEDPDQAPRVSKLRYTSIYTRQADQWRMLALQMQPHAAGPKPTDLADFASRYAAAWSSQDPEQLAAFYAETGSLRVNAGAPAVGRRAIAAKAREFMAAFPDMVVALESVTRDGNRVMFRWRWTGTNAGPGGTGRAVDLRGYEEWVLDADGLILESRGHYDEAEYERQMGG